MSSEAREMDLVECIEKRHSVRAFTNDPVPGEFLDEALRMAALAPSAGNLQARDFIVVRDEETRSKLVVAARGQHFLREAPVVVVCCANLERIESYGPRGRELYCLQDVAASIENLLLYATSKGFGTCWVGAFEERAVSAILNIPLRVRPVAMIAIGVPEKAGKKTPRLRMKEVVHRERW